MAGGVVDDEMQMRAPKHPYHTAGSREGVWSAVLVLVGGFVVGSALPAEAPFYLTFSVSLFLAAAAFLAVSRLFGGWRSRHRARVEAEYRADQQAERERQLVEFRQAKAKTNG